MKKDDSAQNGGYKKKRVSVVFGKNERTRGKEAMRSGSSPRAL